MSIHTRSIGDRTFNAIGFGAMGISAFYGATQRNTERFRVLDRAYELGCRFWDTADVYGDSEELIGEWFRKTGKRNDIFLATKFGLAGSESNREVRGDPEYVKEAAERSLRRLGVDYLDLYYLHRVDQKVPIEKTIGALAELVKAGKVKYLGLSECSSNTLRRAHAVHPISAVEVEYSPFILDIEDPKINLLKTARELGVKIVAYSPLGRGLLTGKYKSVDDFEDGDFRKLIPLYRQNFPQILDISEELRSIGSDHNATAGQVALAWLLAQGEDIIPIPGTKKIKYLEENIGAENVVLSSEEVKRIREAIDRAGLTTTIRDRYPPTHAQFLFLDSPPLEK